MALPSRPNARLGLPSHPSPRVRTLSAPGPQAAVPPRPRSPAALHSGSGTVASTAASSPARPQADRIRPQRSFTRTHGEPGTDAAAGRARADALPPVPALPPLPPPPSKPGTPKMALYARRNGSAASLASASSSSGASSASTSPAASAASFTSVEDSPETSEQKPSASPAPGFGSSLWGRVAAAAGSLTVSVNRAWEANIGVSSGEVTPPGEDSRLARAIKAYHIEKARHPSDLPEWLFSEKERGVRAGSRAAASEATPEAQAQPAHEPPKRAVSPARADPRARAKREVDEENVATMTRAAQRLRELRDQKAAKRTPTIRFADTPHPRHAARIREEAVPPVQPVEPPPLPELPEPRLVTNVRPVASLKSVGKRPNAVGLPASVRPRR